MLINALREMGRPHIVVATKADRLSGNNLAKSLAALKQAHGEDRILPVSSKSEKGVKTLWPEILSVTGQQTLPNLKPNQSSSS